MNRNYLKIQLLGISQQFKWKVIVRLIEISTITIRYNNSCSDTGQIQKKQQNLDNGQQKF